MAISENKDISEYLDKLAGRKGVLRKIEIGGDSLLLPNQPEEGEEYRDNSHWEGPMKDNPTPLITLYQLGSGSQATVYLVFSRDTNRFYAIKKFLNRRVYEEEK